jgi:hypothetical protein
MPWSLALKLFVEEICHGIIFARQVCHSQNLRISVSHLGQTRGGHIWNQQEATEADKAYGVLSMYTPEYFTIHPDADGWLAKHDKTTICFESNCAISFESESILD